MSTFVLRNVALDMFLDIPYSEAAEFKPVELYDDCHGGENQLWQVRNGRIVSVLDNSLCLGALNVCDGEPIILVDRESDKALTWKWGSDRCDFGNDDYLDIRDTVVCSKEESLQIGPAKCGQGIALQKVSSSQQLWKKEEVTKTRVVIRFTLVHILLSSSFSAACISHDGHLWLTQHQSRDFSEHHR